MSWLLGIKISSKKIWSSEGVPILLTATSRLGEMTPQVRILRALPRLFQFGCILKAARCLDQAFPSKWPILATKSLESQELYEIVNGENHRQFFLDAPEKMIGRSARIILVETINLILIKQQLITSGRPVALGGMRHGLGRALVEELGKKFRLHPIITG